MFEALKHAWEVRKITRERDQIARSYRKARAALGDGADDSEVWHEHRAEDRPLEEALAAAQTRYLVRQAERLQIPTPKHNDKEAWEPYDYGWGQVLSPKASLDLRREVRREQKERDEHLRSWLSPIIALCSMIVALAAVLTR